MTMTSRPGRFTALRLARLARGVEKAMHYTPPTDASRLTIEALELTNRTTNCLRAEDIKTIGDLMHWSERRLLATPNFGRRSLNELKETLAGLGLALRKD